MNKRIIELAIESGLPTALDYHQRRTLKFAELIVRECIEQGKQVQSQTVSNGSEDYNEGRKMGIEVFMNQIKKHFRGEE